MWRPARRAGWCLLAIVAARAATAGTCDNQAGEGRTLQAPSEKEQSAGGRDVQPDGRQEDVPGALYELLEVYDHDTAAFTQGLDWYNGALYESTGGVGQSEVRKVDFESGKVVKRSQLLPRPLFGEGMTVHDGTVYQITWLHRQGFTWDAATLTPLGTFRYDTTTGEGWGLCSNGEHFIASDGSGTLHFWDKETLKTVKTVDVTLPDGSRASMLNELEYVKGFVLANVWMQDVILRINPRTGETTHVIDVGALYPQRKREAELSSMDAVLNGIAYDPHQDALYLTGKMWPRMYKVRLLV